MTDANGWRTDMENAPQYPSKECFVVRAWICERNYMTDPWCVFRDADNGFARWPHEHPPTMWLALPAPPHTPPEAQR